MNFIYRFLGWFSFNTIILFLFLYGTYYDNIWLLNIGLFIFGLGILMGIFILCLDNSNVEEFLEEPPNLFLEIISVIYNIGIVILFILTNHYFFAIGYFFGILGMIKYYNIRYKFINKPKMYEKIKKDYPELFI